MKIFAAAALGLLVLPSLAFADTMVVDRGLPTTNLNNAAGDNRSNVGWADTPAYDFYGDTFTLPGGNSAVYAVHTIRTLDCVVCGPQQSVFDGDAIHRYRHDDLIRNCVEPDDYSIVLPRRCRAPENKWAAHQCLRS